MRFALALAALLGAASPASAQEALGRLLWVQCQACHSLGAEGGKVGPTLAGVLGRRAGSVPGYPYSPALKASGLRWDHATLDRFLARPAEVVPGNKMVFAGIADPKRRAALIAYLEKAGGAAEQ